MKEKIHISNVQARDIQDGMKIIKQKYPYARMIAYKFDKDFRYESNKDYSNRMMKIAYVKNFKKIL